MIFVHDSRVFINATCDSRIFKDNDVGFKSATSNIFVGEKERVETFPSTNISRHET